MLGYLVNYVVALPRLCLTTEVCVVAVAVFICEERMTSCRGYLYHNSILISYHKKQVSMIPVLVSLRLSLREQNPRHGWNLRSSLSCGSVRWGKERGKLQWGSQTVIMQTTTVLTKNTYF